MRTRLIASILFMSAAIAGPGKATAQETMTSAGVPVMDEVVVSATKTEEKRKDVPNAMVLIDEMDIEESPASTLGELLANELGIDLRTQGNYGGAAEEIHIRGMKANGSQVFVNGVNINSPSLGSADVGRLPLNNIERIEVIKGSGSLLYGSGAVGGIINIITKRPERDKTDLKFSTGYGSKGAFHLSAEQGMFLLGDIGYYITANYRETDGFRDNSDLDHKDVSLKLVYEKGDALDISLYGDYIERDYGRPGVEPPAGTPGYFINGVPFYNSESASLLDRGGDEDAHLVMEIKSSPLEWLGLRVRGDYAHIENYNYSRYSFDGSGMETWVTNETKGCEGNVELTPFDGGTLLLGTEYKEYDWKNRSVNLDSGGSQVLATAAKIRHDLHTTGSFAEAQYRPSEYFKALAGIRHEDHSEFGTENLPLYGVIINPHENTALKLNHGKHFLAPTPNDLFWPLEDWGWGMGAEGNPDLQPETGWHTDITLEQTFLAGRLFVTGSWFQWDLENRILWADNGFGFWSPTNLRTYEADGFEVGVRFTPLPDWTISLYYTYLDAEEEAEEYDRDVPGTQKRWTTHRATYSPENQFKGTLVYESPFGLTSSLTFRYVSDRLWYRDETTDWVNYKTVVYTLDSYWTTDLKIQQRVGDHWLFTLQGNNLFDKEYDTFFGSFTDMDTGINTVESFPGAGRSGFFSVTYEF
ncbi:MAG: TonB-dependent receptor [Desulfatiglans sp.]|jgi:iron complex outermembrane receptor protein|nr:TonB-dependent receptor [Thermodesulfobacteriota bacterium]MEE4352998.1 TonB-dependent receptor [Desulfatiglans sp.]